MKASNIGDLTDAIRPLTLSRCSRKARRVFGNAAPELQKRGIDSAETAIAKRFLGVLLDADTYGVDLAAATVDFLVGELSIPFR